MSKLKKLAKDLPPATAEKPPKGTNTTISTVLPKDLIKQLKIRAAAEDKTIRMVLMGALSKDGFKIDPAEMVDKRR